MNPLSPRSELGEGQGQVVSHLNRDSAHVGRPSRKILPTSAKSQMKSLTIREQMDRSKTAGCGPGAFGSGGGGYGGGMSGGGMGGGMGANTRSSSGGNFYSPELSTDFLQLPQGQFELWQYFRHFYSADPFVGQAVDQHTEIPMSKLRISLPEGCRNKELAEKSKRFCRKWADRVGLYDKLLSICHDFNLLGEANVWVEDRTPEMPETVRHSKKLILQENGTFSEELEELDDADERTVAWLNKNYKGWHRILVIPPENIDSQKHLFSDSPVVQFMPDDRTRDAVSKADQGDPFAQAITHGYPMEVVQGVRENTPVYMNTDPYSGKSFIASISNNRSDYETRGRSVLQRCLRTLVFADQIRQAQAQIVSRHMTPVRLVYAEGMDVADTEELRDQIDMALMDPDYSIVTNFQVTWEELNSNGRLLEVSGEMDQIKQSLYAGLGVTEGLLSGESSYSGDRINLEVINIRFLHLREKLKKLVEENFFKPMCARMGFVEEDEDGDMVIICPKLSFTRIAIRENQDMFDILFQLYQKGSCDIETIFDVMNIDYEEVQARMKRDIWTMNDPNFNDLTRGVMTALADNFAKGSNIDDIIATNLGVRYKKPDEGGGRF